jgi:hypothetical protein
MLNSNIWCHHKYWNPLTGNPWFVALEVFSGLFTLLGGYEPFFPMSTGEYDWESVSAAECMCYHCSVGRDLQAVCSLVLLLSH